VSNWLSWRYDALGSVVVFAATAFALFGHVSDGYAALVIVQAQEFANASRYLVRLVISRALSSATDTVIRVLAQLELDFNSVDRIVEYLDVSQEKPLIIKETQPPAYWPSSSGQVVVEDLVVRYAPGLPAVLKGINLVIKSSEKIGLVSSTFEFSY
jgi:ABC-type multidrug transport system fused ATPase/permease subunit